MWGERTGLNKGWRLSQLALLIVYAPLFIAILYGKAQWEAMLRFVPSTDLTQPESGIEVTGPSLVLWLTRSCEVKPRQPVNRCAKGSYNLDLIQDPVLDENNKLIRPLPSEIFNVLVVGMSLGIVFDILTVFLRIRKRFSCLETWMDGYRKIVLFLGFISFLTSFFPAFLVYTWFRKIRDDWNAGIIVIFSGEDVSNQEPALQRKAELGTGPYVLWAVVTIQFFMLVALVMQSRTQDIPDYPDILQLQRKNVLKAEKKVDKEVLAGTKAWWRDFFATFPE